MGGGGLHAYFGALNRHHRARRKKTNTAIMITARRMCNIIFCVFHKNRPYQARVWSQNVPGCPHQGRTEHAE